MLQINSSAFRLFLFFGATLTLISCREPQVDLDAPVGNDIVTYKPRQQLSLDSAYEQADTLMKADTPLDAGKGVEKFNDLMRACASYTDANVNDGGAAASYSVSQALSLGMELKAELLARFPKEIEEGEPITILNELYAGPGRWIGPRQYLKLVGQPSGS